MKFIKKMPDIVFDVYDDDGKHVGNVTYEYDAFGEYDYISDVYEFENECAEVLQRDLYVKNPTARHAAQQWEEYQKRKKEFKNDD